MILFGWYSFLLKAYMLEELGIKVDDPTQHMQVEVRQRCFHLFWVPFFSLGKIYAFRKDGKLYNLTPELEATLRKHTVHKTPWYTYIGFILVFFGFIFYNANEKYEAYRSRKSLEELRAAKREILTNPIIGDEYTMGTDKISNTFYARVADLKSDSVLLKIVQLEKREWGDRRAQIISFNDEDLKFAPQWTTTAEILNATPIDDYHCNDSLQLYLPELGGITLFEIREMERNGKSYR
jgi:hypothetical protein